MKAIILCAGYATRLYPFTINEPKALLMVDGKPLLSYTIKNLQNIDLDKIFVVTNNKFYHEFLDWKEREDKKVKIINDKTNKNGERLGGVIDMALVLEEVGEDDVLVVLGDNFFNFNIKEFVEFFNKKKETCIALHDITDRDKAKRFGVVGVNEEKIISFKEKPENPQSTLISTGCYIFSRKDLDNIKEYIKSDKNKEGPGYIIKDFIENGKKIHGFIFKESWYDIGTIEDYEKIKKEIKNMGK